MSYIFYFNVKLVKCFNKMLITNVKCHVYNGLILSSIIKCVLY